MNNKIRKLSILSLCLLGGCLSINKNIIKDNNKIVIQRYSQLLFRTNDFLSESNQLFFKDSVSSFVKKDTFSFKSERFEPIVGYPIIVSADHKKAIIPIIIRTKGISGARIEYVKFLCGIFGDNKWKFGLHKVQVDSFSYENNHPTITDTEMGIEFVRNLMLSGYFVKSAKDESIFSSSIYILH